jgi:predicted nucleic acid-binding protein
VTLVDSDVLIAHLRGAPAAQRYLLHRRRLGRLHVSAISLVEVTGGMRSADRREVWHLLDSLDVEGIDHRVAVRAGQFVRTYRRSHAAIGLPDYLIAATADVRGLQLATLNVKHYPMFVGLEPPFALD